MAKIHLRGAPGRLPLGAPAAFNPLCDLTSATRQLPPEIVPLDVDRAIRSGDTTEGHRSSRRDVFLYDLFLGYHEANSLKRAQRSQCLILADENRAEGHLVSIYTAPTKPFRARRGDRSSEDKGLLAEVRSPCRYGPWCCWARSGRLPRPCLRRVLQTSYCANTRSSSVKDKTRPHTCAFITVAQIPDDRRSRGPRILAGNQKVLAARRRTMRNSSARNDLRTVRPIGPSGRSRGESAGKKLTLPPHKLDFTAERIDRIAALGARKSHPFGQAPIPDLTEQACSALPRRDCRARCLRVPRAARPHGQKYYAGPAGTP